MSDSGRTRASKACQRCSQRKIKCDAIAFGLPCSRCRSDGITDCKLSESRRGAHKRRKLGCASSGNVSTDEYQSLSRIDSSSQQTVSKATHRPDPMNSHNHAESENRISDASHAIRPPIEVDVAPSELIRSSRFTYDPNQAPVRNGTMQERYNKTVPVSITDNASSLRSPAQTFVEFMKRKAKTEKNGGLSSYVLLAESSPLTYALTGARMTNPAASHDRALDLTEAVDTAANHDVPQRLLHPPHMSSDDIAYLQAKGVFDFPDVGFTDAMFETFMSQFYPLYSIVDKDALLESYNQNTLPWLSQHTICFIGATFCSADTIHTSPFKQRLSARQFFYEKAKILFDIGYETSKIVLLQSAIMLTFWGPQISSYWNPSIWVDIATTISASLAAHRKSEPGREGTKHARLVRRLWWTVLGRDACCATLLGRPFRSRMSQCDAEMLSVEDFDLQPQAHQVDGVKNLSWTSALYQIQCAKLSLIFREIVLLRSSGQDDTARRQELHTSLTAWQAELPDVLDWTKQNQAVKSFATSLKIIFNHHLILLYLSERNSPTTHGEKQTANRIESPSETMIKAAQVIASSALTVITTSLVGAMPHEIYQGYFIAGIVLYRQMNQQGSYLAELWRSALDNCQMVLNEAREHYDAANWMMSIFEFLLSDTPETNADTAEKSNTNDNDGFSTTVSGSNYTVTEDQTDYSGFGTYSTDWTLPLSYGNDDLVDDFLSIPNLYSPFGSSFQPRV